MLNIPDKQQKILSVLIVLFIIALGVQTYQIYKFHKTFQGRLPEVKAVEVTRSQSGGGAGSASQKEMKAKGIDRATSPAAAAPDIDRFLSPDPLAQWDPFQEMQRIQERMDQMFNQSFSRFRTSQLFDEFGRDFAFSPDMDMQETENAYIVKTNLPGTEEAKIDIVVEGRQLSISGETEQVKKEEEGGEVIRQERREGRFQRTILLPGPVKTQDVEANLDKGVLTITLPKGEEEEEGKTTITIE